MSDFVFECFFLCHTNKNKKEVDIKWSHFLFACCLKEIIIYSISLEILKVCHKTTAITTTQFITAPCWGNKNKNKNGNKKRNILYYVFHCCLLLLLFIIQVISFYSIICSFSLSSSFNLVVHGFVWHLCNNFFCIISYFLLFLKPNFHLTILFYFIFLFFIYLFLSFAFFLSSIYLFENLKAFFLEM